MADYTIDFVGWNTDGTSDKVWGFFHLEGQPNVFYTFWGKRWTSNGPVLTFKRPGGMFWQFEEEASKKKNKGYNRCTLPMLEKAQPGFTNAFEQRFVMTRLCDSFHPNGRT